MSQLIVNKYTIEQAECWLERIGLSKSFRPNHGPGRDLDGLTTLQRASLATMPFDDAELHYSKHHTITLDLQGLYHRMVTRRLGGYCMQGNTLFEYMARALGFTVYSTGARVRPRKDRVPSGPYLGWVHQVNIFTLADGSKYAVDVAYGGDAAISPMPMVENEVIANIGTRRTRLARQAIGVDAGQLFWIYQIQFDPVQVWHDVYCFNETEFLPQDFGVMSYWTSTHVDSWMTLKYVGIKMIIKDGEIIGKYTIDHDTVKRVVHGRSEHVAHCKTEAERIEVLEKYFTLVFNDEEKEAIRGRPAEIMSQMNEEKRPL